MEEVDACTSCAYVCIFMNVFVDIDFFILNSWLDIYSSWYTCGIF